MLDGELSAGSTRRGCDALLRRGAGDDAARLRAARRRRPVAVGADEVAAALAPQRRGGGIDVEIVRTGSRGLFWLEPLVEVETPTAAIGYGRSTPARRRRACRRRPVRRRAAPARASAWSEDMPCLKRQTRLTFARCGIIDPLSLDDYRAHGGFAGPGTGARRSGRRRSSRRWSRPACAAAAAPASRPASSGGPSPRRTRRQKYIVCNADEGDSGTFADRMLMEGDPFMLIEGMAIAGLAVGATKGYVYIRSEYPHADRARCRRAIDTARRGRPARRRRRWAAAMRFDIEVRVGAGAYVCGEETVAAREPRGQARRGPRQAAAAGA